MTHTPVIRHMQSHADYVACVALQRATWGEAFREVVPAAMLMITQKVGGITAGAYAGDELVGFVYGVTGWLDGGPVHWSHMLAVAESHRDRGIGRRLKEYQREQLTRSGIARMRWTFDPLVARNAHLNLTRLGVRIVEYAPDMYGDDPASTMDSVIRSDRFVVEWDLRAEGRNGGTADTRDDDPVITLGATTFPDASRVRVRIPRDIQELKHDAPDEARAWRAMTRAAFQHYLAGGFRVTGIVREGEHGSSYLLERA